MNANYRKKDFVTVIDELVYLNRRYKVDKFFFSDNIISMHCFDDLLPDLAKVSQGAFQLHWEIKANLLEHHIRKLKEAGTVWIQPGIENLHDDALKAMGKGTSGIRNIQLLKYARMHEINTIWNYLTNIPKEEYLWYEEVIDWIDTVSHLQPPAGIYPLRLERFSLYEREPEVYNIKLKMNPIYQIVYPEKQHNIQNLCRFYENANDNGVKNQGPPFQMVVCFSPIRAEGWQRLKAWFHKHISGTWDP
jgi:magnesium-protoporphyrin IX monomethyl ester (oxidative) cyclase